jgi:hypothetical protein
VVAAGGAVNSTSGGETKINRMQGKSFRLAAQQEKSLAATKMVHTYMPLSKRLKLSTKSQAPGKKVECGALLAGTKYGPAHWLLPLI